MIESERSKLNPIVWSEAERKWVIDSGAPRLMNAEQFGALLTFHLPNTEPNVNGSVLMPPESLNDYFASDTLVPPSPLTLPSVSSKIEQDLREEVQQLRDTRLNLENTIKFLKRRVKWSEKRARTAESKVKDADFIRALLEELLEYGYISLPNPDDERATGK